MSPLAEAIYQILVQRANLAQPPMTYSELVRTLGLLGAPHDDLTPDDPHLFDALGEVGTACRDRGLPILTSLVVRGSDGVPGAGYYYFLGAGIGNDPARRRDAWEHELERVRSTRYPASVQQVLPFQQPDPPDDRQGSRQLGVLRIAEASLKAGTVFTGLLTCSLCARSFEIEVQKNPNAMTEKQPTFLILPTKASHGNVPSGHLFIGTHLSSPVLYYGSVKHCDHEQRVSVFFNRALRDRSDAHLIIAPSISKAVSS